MITRKKSNYVPAIAMCAFLMSSALPTSVMRADLVFNMDFVYSGGTPLGSTPWATATFSQQTAMSVRLTMQANALVSGQFIGQWDFNFDPAVNLSSTPLTFTSISGSSVVTSIAQGQNNQSADGSMGYDIQFNFNTPAGSRFDTSDTVVYDISMPSAAVLVAGFNYLNGGGLGSFHTGLHAQGIPQGTGTCSGWVSDQAGSTGSLDPTCGQTAVPEPSTYATLGACVLLALFALSSRRNLTSS